MDRSILYSQEQMRSFDFLSSEHDTLYAISELAADLLGQTTTVVAGLAATQTSPTASLSINIAAGDIYELADADAAAVGAIPQDLTQILQQGTAAAQQVTLSTTGISSGQSRWSLIQAQFSQVDVIRASDPNGGVLFYYNAANPSQPLQGPGGGGGSQPTERTGQLVIQVVNGGAATTGSEVPPSPTSGWVPLDLIDLSFGQTQITTGEILVAGPSVGTNVPSNYTQAPFLAGLLNSHHGGITGQAPKIKLASETQGTLPAANLPGVFSGQCSLQLSSATQIVLKPRNGQNVAIQGQLAQIPAAGITAGTTGVLVNGSSGNLAASTPYYVSVYNNSGTPTLAFWAASTYGHMPDTTAGNIGTEVIESSGTPNSAHSLVGLLATNASTQFSDADGSRLLLSWFNRAWKRSQTTFSTNRTTTSAAAFVELNSEIRNNFLCWSTDNVRVHLNGTASNSTTSPISSAISFDGGTVETPTSTDQTSQVNAPSNISLNFEKEAGILSETAQHYATVEGAVFGASETGTWYAATTPGSNSAVVLGIEVNG